MSRRSPPWWRRTDRTRSRLAGVFGIVFAVATGHPALADAAAEVEALVDRAVDHIQTVGQRQAFADITRGNGGFVVGELYVFCNAFDGTVLAHGGNPKLVGKSFLNVRDPDGRLRTVEVIRLAEAQGRGWLEYRWPNPGTNRIARKRTFVVRVDDHTACASGYYLPDPP